MNSRNSENETNLVNFSADLSTLNQLDSKEGLLSFPFDHLYACHSESSDRRQPLQFEKEIEISTHCVEEKPFTAEISRLNDQVTIIENQNKKLKDLLIFHLDLIQQQNEVITKRDKLYDALKQENDTLKAKLIRMDRGIGLSPRFTSPTSTITSGVLNNPPVSPQVILDSFTELLLTDTGNSLLCDKSQGTSFGIARTNVQPFVPDASSFPAVPKVPIKVPVLDKKKANSAVLNKKKVNPVPPVTNKKKANPVSPVLNKKKVNSVSPGLDKNKVNSISPGLDKKKVNSVTSKLDKKKVNFVSPGLDNKKVNSVSPGLDTKKVNPILPGLDKKKVNPILPGLDKKKVNPISPGLDKKKVNSISPGLDKKKVNPISPGLDKKKVNPISPGLDRKKVNPTSPGLDKKKVDPVTPGVDKKKVNSVSPGSEKKKVNPVSSGLDKKKKVNTVSPGLDKKVNSVSPSLDKKKVNSIPPVLDTNQTMIDNKRPIIKKEPDAESEAMYTVTSNSGNTVIQRIHRNKRRSTNIGSLSRMSKIPKTEDPTPSTSQTLTKGQSYDSTFGVNKKVTTQFTGSLCDRLRLIDTTPTGEDPYQLGEAEMREQSPIPKLMLQKTNHGRMKICTDTSGEITTRRIYDMPDTKSKLNRFMSVYDQPKKEEKTVIVQEPDLDIVKTETDISWPDLYNDRPLNDTSLLDFSFSDASLLPSLDANEFQELFNSESAFNLDSLNQLDEPPDNIVPENLSNNMQGVATSSQALDEEVVVPKRGTESRRGRKRAFSATGVAKPRTPKAPPKPRAPRGRGGAAARGKRSPLPDLMTDKPYPTLVGDPDLSWYYGLDPEMKHDDVDPPLFTQTSTVEVPRWREKPYTSTYTLEGTENLDDRVFEKRHQKLEAEERRQLRWHMRRVREQRHVEKLRLRQKDSWCSYPVNPPAMYSVWPRPQQDAHFLEITGTLPVNGFGEPLPEMPKADFMLPWVRTSKALKRSKRSKTLH